MKYPDTECDCIEVPYIQPGMLVSIYLHGTWDKRGWVLSVSYDELYEEYYSEVQLVGGEVESFWSADLQRVSYSGSVQYALLKQRTINGGLYGR